jgi:hypothetical protein
MKCIYCQEKAGFFKRICPDCLKLVEILKAAPSTFGYRDLLDRLLATDVSNEKIEKFLDADVDGQGSINDQITARMTNEVMASLGQPSQMTATDVKKVRQDIAEGKAPSKMDQEVTDYSQLPHKQ